MRAGRQGNAIDQAAQRLRRPGRILRMGQRVGDGYSGVFPISAVLPPNSFPIHSRSEKLGGTSKYKSGHP